MINNSFFKGKTVFITGHSGFKGCWLCETLFLMGAKVIGYSPIITEEVLYNSLELSKKVTNIKGDILDLDLITKTLKKYKPDIVIHMAAQPVVRYAIEDPVSTYKTNVIGTATILEAVRRCDSVKSFLNVTSDKVYFNDDSKKIFKEDDVLCGIDPYANSKSCSELVTYSFKKTYFDDKEYPRISTARAGNTIGGGRFLGKTLLNDCVEAIRKGETLSLRNPEAVRPYQHVLDTLNVYLKIVEMQYKDKKYEGNYNVGPDLDEYATNGKVVDLFYKYWYKEEKNNCWKESYPDIKESEFIFLDNSKTKELLNVKPKYTLEKTINSIVKWYQNYFDNNNMEEYSDKEIISFFEKE